MVLMSTSNAVRDSSSRIRSAARGEWPEAREPAPLSLIYFGDAQNDLKSHWSRVVREAFKDAPRATVPTYAEPPPRDDQMSLF